MTDYNAGSYANSSSIIYTDSGSSSGGIHWVGHDGYYYPQPYDSVGIGEVCIKFTPEPEQNNRKEIDDMVQRQTFLDALTDEGKSVSSEGRDVVKEAKADKWELFIARLLARAFIPDDLAMLKGKPKQVEVLTKEA